MKFKAYVILSAIFFGINPTLMTLTYRTGASASATTCLSALFAGALCLLAAWRMKLSFRLSPKLWAQALLTGFSGAICNQLLASAYQYVAPGIATMLHFIYPTVVTVLLLVFFREKIGRWKLLALLCSTAGIVLISWGAMEGSVKGVILALASSVFWAYYIISLGKFEIGKENSIVVCTVIYFVRVLVLLPYGLLNHSFTLPSTSGWILILLVSLLSLTASALFQIATRNIGSFSAGIFSAFEPATSFLVSCLVFQHTVQWMQFVGVAAVITGLILDSVGTRQVVPSK